jgi:hypothetical protein
MASLVIFFFPEDGYAAEEIADRLAKAGHGIFMAELGVAWRPPWGRLLAESIRYAHAGIVLVSRSSVEAPFWDIVFSHDQLSRKPEQGFQRLLSVVIDEVEIPPVLTHVHPIVSLDKDYTRIVREITRKVYGMQSDKVSRRVSIAVGLIAAIIALTSLLLTLNQMRGARGRLPEHTDTLIRLESNEKALQEVRQRVQDLTALPSNLPDKGQKLCKVLGRKKWRDTVVVPQTWSVGLCADYMKKTGGTTYQLGCIFADRTTLGKEGGTHPEPNCGWE